MIITDQNAYLAAAHCQGCQDPKCVDGCPAGIDIPGFMRRMEAKNYTGAARVIREKNPFGEVCGLVCTPNQTCQKDCYRRDFTGAPVRIAELQSWVCAAAGDNGWIKSTQIASRQKVAVMGGGPSALTCAYYLTLAGYKVTVFAQEAQPGGALLARAGTDPILNQAVLRDLQGLMAIGIGFEANQSSVMEMDIKQVLENYDAIYLPEAGLTPSPGTYNTWPGSAWGKPVDQYPGQPASHPGVFIGKEYLMNGVSVVEAVDCGRKAACSIDQYIRSKAS